MKNLIQSFALLSTICLLFFNCKGEQGAVGPAGPQGIQGAAGPAGPQGAIGTANIQQINFTERTHTGITDLFFGFPAATTVETVEKSLVHVYVKQTVKAANGANVSYWFAIPGETSNGNEYGFYIALGSGTAPSGVFLRRVVNYVSGNEKFDAVRVLITPAGVVTNGRKATINWQDYEEVRHVFGLPE